MPAMRYISWFKDIGLADRPKVGGKGGSLGELHRAGITVPPGFIVRTEAFEGFIDELERREPVRTRVEGLAADELKETGAVSRELRARIEDASLPVDLQQEIRDAYGRLGESEAPPAVAVRSSATTEDAADASFAGLQDTYLWVTRADAVMRKIQSCWASLYSVESLSYRRRHGIAESTVAMAVVVQTMVDARTAGVMFTRSPVSGDRSVVAIEGAWGLGSALVGGEVTPDRWVVGKITGEISVREISDKAIRHARSPSGGVEELPVEKSLRREPCLSDEELQSLRAIGRQVERHYGRPQDIEWAIDRHTQRILLLQSRPETVWSNKDGQAGSTTRVSRPALACHEDFWRTKVTLTAADVAEIMRIVEQSKFDELNLEIDGVKLTLRRAGAAGAFTRSVTRPAGPSDAMAAPGADSPAARTAAGAAAPAPVDPNVRDITSPMLGTFYRAPKPGAAPFVEIGSAVDEESVIAIIEVMKLMNTVRAGVKGVVTEILPADEALVEFGEVLMRARVDA